MLASRLRPEVATADFRLCLLSAAAALGVVCTFGTPVGGVLFSIVRVRVRVRVLP